MPADSLVVPEVLGDWRVGDVLPFRAAGCGDLVEGVQVRGGEGDAALVGFVMAASYRAGTRDGFLGVLSVAGYLATLSIAVYAVIVMLYSVWLPHEKLTITGVNPSPVGYVLSDDPDGWITIPLSRQHGIVSYRDTEVTNQQICESAPYNNWSQLTNATTVWQEITKLGPLTYPHPAVEPPCFKPRSAA